MATENSLTLTNRDLKMYFVYSILLTKEHRITLVGSFNLRKGKK